MVGGGVVPEIGAGGRLPVGDHFPFVAAEEAAEAGMEKCRRIQKTDNRRAKLLHVTCFSETLNGS